jgi:hypothetical protein
MADAGFEVHITSKCDPIAAGDEASMEITVVTPESHEKVTLEWEVFWTATGKTTNKNVVCSGSEPIPGLEADTELSFTIPFTIPRQGPISYEGMLLTVAWFVKVSLDIPWAIDPKSTFGFVVGPRLLAKKKKVARKRESA